MSYIDRIKDLKRKRLKAEVKYAIGLICETGKDTSIKEDTMFDLTFEDLIDILEIVMDNHQCE